MSPSLSDLLTAHRAELIERWTNMVARQTSGPPLERAELVDQMPRFIDALVAALDPVAIPQPPAGREALEHGSQRLGLGFNVGEVVREYAILHRCIIAIAAEARYTMTTREQNVLATELNDGIGNAVSQYVSERDNELRRQMAEHLGFIAHEVRNPLSSAVVALQLLQKRELASGGRVVELLARTLRRTSDVIDNALNHATLSLGVAPRLEPLRLRDLLSDIVLDFGAEAERKNVEIALHLPGDPTIEADRRLLGSAISNLVQNALKFTRLDSTIQVRAHHLDGVFAIEVEDACGGLPPGKAEDLFKPLVRGDQEQTGFGLGLAIAQQAAVAHGGSLSVRDLPGQGCVFRLELPARGAPAAPPDRVG